MYAANKYMHLSCIMQRERMHPPAKMCMHPHMGTEAVLSSATSVGQMAYRLANYTSIVRFSQLLIKFILDSSIVHSETPWT